MSTNSNNNNNYINQPNTNGNNSINNLSTHVRIEHANHHDLSASTSSDDSIGNNNINNNNNNNNGNEQQVNIVQPQPQSQIQSAALKKKILNDNLISNERRESIIRELQQIKAISEYPSSASQYNIIEPIGEGTEGRVFKAYCIPLKENVAIKVVELDRMDPQFVKDVIKEVRVMNGNNHPNLIHYHTSFLENNQLWLVMDYLGGGSLADIIKHKYPEGIPEVLAITILKSLLKGLEYLHSHQRIHRDLKSDNILIGNDGAIELADFGVSAMFEKNTISSRKTIVGTPCWMAPEIISERGYNQGVDIWSFGITAIELIRGKPPGCELPPSKVFMNLLFGNSPSLLEEEEKGLVSHLYKDMVDKCLQKEPSKRPSAAKLLEHKVFKAAKKNNYIVTHLLHGLTPCEDRYRESMSPSSSNSPSPNSSRPSSPEYDSQHGNINHHGTSGKSPALNKSSSSLEFKNKNISNSLDVNMPRAASHPVELNSLENNHLNCSSSGTNCNNVQRKQQQQQHSPLSSSVDNHSKNNHHSSRKNKQQQAGLVASSGSLSPPLSTSPEKERKKGGFFNHFRRHSIAKLFGSPKDGDHHHHDHAHSQQQQQQPIPHSQQEQQELPQQQHIHKSNEEEHHHFHFPWKHHHSPNHVESS